MSDWVAGYHPHSLPLDQEALRIYERAYHIGIQVEHPDTPPISFTAVIAALLDGTDPTSRWFADQARQLGPDPDAVRRSKNITGSILDNLRSADTQSGRPRSVRLSKDRHLLTSSARAILQSAEEWAQRVGGSDIGVRHLVASYVLNPPPNHRQQLQEWRFDELAWRSAFFRDIPPRFTFERWEDASQRPAPAAAFRAFEHAGVKGESLAWPGDAAAMQILARAARQHTRTEDRWLRFQTVFDALVETANDDERMRDAVLPVWQAVQDNLTGYQEALRRNYVRAAEGEPQAFSKLDISPRVLNALETARELAAASLRPSADVIRKFVSPLHLAGALLSRRVDGERSLTDLGLAPRALRLALIAHAATRGESEEVWREMLGEEDTVITARPIDINSDDPEAVIRLDEKWLDDPLAIRRDVETFGALLASRTLEPPLSIGLFGPWGSGKTTFLRRLRRAVDSRTEQARQQPASTGSQPSPFVKNVVHVEFNAWHFAETALVSSLVDTIFRTLSSFIKDDQKVAGRQWRDVKLRDLETARRKVEAAEAFRNSARTALTQAEAEVEKMQQQAAASAASLNAAVKTAWTSAYAALASSDEVKGTGVLEAIGETVTSAEELRNRLDSIRQRPARLLGDLGWPRSILFAALVLALPPLAALLVRRVFAVGEVSGLLSSTTAVLLVINFWLRAGTQAMSKVDVALRKIADTYEEKVNTHPLVIQARAGLATARASAEAAETGLRTARTELARAEAEAANATLPAQMLQLVSTRVEDRSYSQELTSLSLARADLQVLSQILRDHRIDGASASSGERAVDRVILYIDDLDRCKPADVVRVLQLVHMLLAFELFAVVVAVDVRWVEHALRNSYYWRTEGADDGGPGRRATAAAAPGDSAMTPQEYLEKIFQVAFWLEPMTTPRAASYLASLVREPFREHDGGRAAPPDARAGNAASPWAGRIEITGVELDYMRALAAHVGPSPRRVKRLVNAYRLIKARMSDAQLGTFVDPAGDGGDGPYQIVIGLLVIAMGAQSESAQIINELAEIDPTDSLAEVVSGLDARAGRDWTMAARVIETMMRTQRISDCSALRGWARQVRRFLLYGPSADIAPPPAAPARRADEGSSAVGSEGGSPGRLVPPPGLQHGAEPHEHAAAQHTVREGGVAGV